MAITVTERWSGDSLDEQSPDARHYTLGGTRSFDVTTDDPADDTSFTIATLMTDPQLRTAFPEDLFMRCTSIQIQRLSPIHFLVSASYFMRGSINGGPLSLPPIVSWADVVTEEEIPFDISGNGICTVLGEPFDPPPRVPVYDRVLTITRNVLTYDDDWAGQFRNAVNSSTFANQPAGTVRCIGLSATSTLDEDFSYWSVTGQFQVRKAAPGSTDDKAWYLPVQAAGLYVKRGGIVKYGLIDLSGADEQSNWTTVPVYHDTTTGAQLTRGTSIQYYFLQVFPSVDLNTLGLI